MRARAFAPFRPVFFFRVSSRWYCRGSIGASVLRSATDEVLVLLRGVCSEEALHGPPGRAGRRPAAGHADRGDVAARLPAMVPVRRLRVLAETDVLAAAAESRPV